MSLENNNMQMYTGLIKVLVKTKGQTNIYMSQSFAKEMGFRTGDKLKIALGSVYRLTALVRVRNLPNSAPNAIWLSLGTNSRICLPSGLELQSYWSPSKKELKIGPIMGIFTNSTKLEEISAKRRLFGSQSGTFKDLMKVGWEKNTMIYAFTPADVDFESGIIRGYHHMPGKNGTFKWIRRSFPMPDVVYNRIPKRSDEARTVVSHVKRRLTAIPNLQMFNKRFLDKWQVHRFLTGLPELQGNILDTLKCRSSSSVLTLLNRHGQVFLKPAANSLGNGAMRVRSVPKGFTWELNIPGRGTKRKNINSTHALCNLIMRAIKDRPYLVQKCITLAKYRGRPFDIRVLVQKDDTGIWKLTGMAARIAQKDRITTHIPNGGYAQPLLRTLKTAFAGTEVNPEAVAQQIGEATLMAARAVDTGAKGGFGELSMDVGIDQEGLVWIFEVNAKPFRFDEERIRQLALRRVVGYSNYLSGFAECGSEVKDAREIEAESLDGA